MTRIEIQTEVTRTCRNIEMEARDDRRDFHTHEDLFFSAVAAISRKCNSLIGDAKRNPLMKPDDVERIERLANRTEAKELADALASYKRAREEFYNADDELLEIEAAVAEMMLSEAAE